jgi:AraC-like DNA-binding protein
MNSIEIISLLSIVIFILFLLLGAFLLTVKTQKKLSNRLLAAFLIITAIDISAFFYYKLFELPLYLEMLRVQISNFKDPLLFLYILSVIYSNFELQRKHLVHLLPWLISILVLCPNFFFVDHSAQVAFFTKYTTTWEYKLLRLFGYLLEVSYISAEIYYLIRYRKLLLENYTNKISFVHYNWLKELIIFILIGQVLTFIKASIRDNQTIEITDFYRIFLLLFGVIFSFWLVLKALHSPKLFRGITVDLKLSKELIAKIGTIKNETTLQIDALKKHMKTNEPFLDSSLTIQDLANQMNLNVRDISILINQTIGQHFFDFVNQYRIEKAKSILKNPDKKALTILEILYEVGFNSKSSFNTAFKNYTGFTPTQYRKNN